MFTDCLRNAHCAQSLGTRTWKKKRRGRDISQNLSRNAGKEAQIVRDYTAPFRHGAAKIRQYWKSSRKTGDKTKHAIWKICGAYNTVSQVSCRTRPSGSIAAYPNLLDQWSYAKFALCFSDLDEQQHEALVMAHQQVCQYLETSMRVRPSFAIQNARYYNTTNLLFQ
jgi:hypothetical protein